jgi:hypothetical protein
MSEVREFDIASPLSVILNEVIVYTGQHGQRFGDEPEKGSPADLETRNTGGAMSPQRLSDIVSTQEEAAGVCILSAGHLFASFTQLFRPDMALFGFQVVARAIVENSIKVWGLVDPAVSVNTRLARLYVDNLTNINEMHTAGRLSDGVGDFRAVDARRKALVKRAAAAGIVPKISSKDKLVGFGKVSKPESTKLAGQFFKALGFEHGEYWYRNLSAVAHGTAYGLLDYLKMVDVPGSDLKTLYPNLNVEDVLHAAILSMQAYLGAIEFHSRLFGWDHPDVAQHRAAFQEQMMAATPGR